MGGGGGRGWGEEGGGRGQGRRGMVGRGSDYDDDTDVAAAVLLIG